MADGPPASTAPASRLGSIRRARHGESARASAGGTAAAAGDDAGGDAGARASGVNRGRTGTFVPRVPSKTRASRDADGGVGVDEVALPPEVARVVSEARAGGSRRSATAGTSGGRRVKRAEEGDWTRVTIGGGGGGAGASPTRLRARATAAAAAAVKEEPRADAMETDVSGREAAETHAMPGTPVRAALEPTSGVQTTPARQARMSKVKQAQLALEEASRRIQHDRLTEEDIYDAEDEWVDKTQYYPTVLTRSAREIQTVAVGEVLRSTTDDRFVVMQLPTYLPLRKNGASSSMEVDGVVTVADDDQDLHSDDSGVVRSLDDLSDGKLGELKIHADGSTKLYIGDAVFDVMNGTPYQHAEQLARLDADNQQFVVMGDTIARLTCVPDVTQLLL